MSIHVWTIPDEMFLFINRQFVRFSAPYPPEKALDEVGQFVMEYVSDNDYYPRNPSEASDRFANIGEGLNSAEKLALIGPLEYRVKIQLQQIISFDQLHLACWAALLWCWSEEGEFYVRFHKKAKASAESLYDRRHAIDLTALALA